MGKASETQSYAWIKDKLKRFGWATRNPSRNERGEVYTQHECSQHDEIKKNLDGGVPEFVLKISARDFCIVEAKPHPKEIKQALKEAQDYANQINNQSKQISAPIAIGVAGSDDDGYEVETTYFDTAKSKWRRVLIEGKPLHRLPKKPECERIISQKSAELARPEFTTREIVELSALINRRLHKAKVTKEKRAPTIAVLLSALSSHPDLKLQADANIFIDDINTRAKKIFEISNKLHLWNQIHLVAPSEDNAAYADALDDVIRYLHEADIVSATPDADVLGQFFENFLRYGNTSKDIGIVLTPRHICWLAAEALNISHTDLLYDPALGTGGFLIAAYNRVKSKSTPTDAVNFAKNRIFGCEQNGPVATLAFINMFFRGDGKHNLRNATCFGARLAGASVSAKTARFKEGSEFGKKEHLAATRVLMNPPFALKQDDEKEYRFVDHALAQLQDNGLLFAVLPSSVMYSQEFHWWRQQILAHHTLQSVILFPNDLFYPVAVESVGVFIKKSIPHENEKVLWVRLDNDGFSKWKGFRVERKGSHWRDALSGLGEALRKWCTDGKQSPDVTGYYEFKKIRGTELIPQAHLGTPKLDETTHVFETKKAILNYLTTRWRLTAELL